MMMLNEIAPEGVFSPEERQCIDEQMASCRPDTVQRLKDLIASGGLKCDASNIKPLPRIVPLYDNTNTLNEHASEWGKVGMDLIASGKVAVLLVAGGQGTRLGFDHPKGMYDVGLPSHKTLFQLQAERLLKMTQLARSHAAAHGIVCPSGPLILWCVMTSDATHQATVDYFTRSHFFGLFPDSVRFFQQGMLPAVDATGKILLEKRNKLAISPNGNGGVHQALVDSGLLSELESRGVEYLFQYSVDNIVVKMVDPVLMGFVHCNSADVCAKVVPKAHADEPVGVVCLKDGRPGVAEYSEITPAARSLRDDNGQLLYSASHICINVFSVPFLRKNALQPLPFHLAFKKLDYVNPQGESIIPPGPNAYKAEMFIFDIFQYAENMMCLMVPRKGEFSPLKNPRGSRADCPETCLSDLSSLHIEWIKKAGGTVDASDSSLCEISPLVSVDGENLEPIVSGRSFRLPLHIS
ncbi:UDP-N-acetylglucosamine pyrophosphorylase [Pelomyxa schiedti]|nr:UDP-N-acetylglucosamine pyrophosphorylase [Pelomyxa schiedti]